MCSNCRTQTVCVWAGHLSTSSSFSFINPFWQSKFSMKTNISCSNLCNGHTKREWPLSCPGMSRPRGESCAGHVRCRLDQCPSFVQVTSIISLYKFTTLSNPITPPPPPSALILFTIPFASEGSEFLYWSICWNTKLTFYLNTMPSVRLLSAV